MDRDALAFNLRRLRKAQGLTVRALGDASGLSGATISRLESGIVSSETAGQLPGLAKALGVAVDDLLTMPARR